MTDKPIVIDEVAETDVYIATLELRSVGTGKNIYPMVTYSHMFSTPPAEEDVPYSYRAILQIAEMIGAVVTEEEGIEVNDGDDIDTAVRKLEEMMKGKGDGPVH